MDKETFRKEIKARIAAFDREYITESDRAIFKNITALPEFVMASRVFTYLSIGREPDTRQLILLCRKLGKTVALPFDFQPDGFMSFAKLDRPVQELAAGIYGIPAPPADAERLEPVKGDILIVPALCCDEKAYRLGRGGGYYDRFLAGHPVFSAGLCRETLFVGSVPRNVYDKRVSCVVTDKRIARPK